MMAAKSATWSYLKRERDNDLAFERDSRALAKTGCCFKLFFWCSFGGNFGDGNGMVGHGKGKAKEVPEAIKKATEEAKSKMIRVPLRQGRTLHHDIKGRFDSGKVYLRSAPSGTGVIAGGPMRAVFEALGIQDIVAKSVGTSNPHNMVRATFEALKSASSPKIIAVRRSLKINDITKRRKISNFGGENVKN